MAHTKWMTHAAIFYHLPQPFYATNFAQTNEHDGFFQRFMISIPEEVYITRKQKKETKNQNSVKNGLDMQKVLARIFKRSIKKKQDMYEENKVAVMSRSVGLIMRLSGVICLLRNAVSEINDEQLFDGIAIENDLNMTNIYTPQSRVSKWGNITEYCVNSRFALLSYESCTKSKGERPLNAFKLPVSEPEIFTMDYVVTNHKFVKKYLITPSVPISLVSRGKMYFIVQNTRGNI